MKTKTRRTPSPPVVHGPIHYLTYIETIADALALSVKEGLVKTVGVSNYSVPEMRRMHAALAKHNIQVLSWAPTCTF